MVVLYIGFIVAVQAWNYDSHGEDWTGLCSDGNEQSPINIKSSKTSSLGSDYSMEVYYYGTTTSRTVVNDGNVIYIEGDFGYITIEDLDGKDRKFLTTKLIFHVPSEHYFESFPTHMELQIYHEVDDSDYTFDFPTQAVVSVMLRPGDESYFFNSLDVYNLPKSGEENVLPSDTNLNLLSIVETDDDYYFYHGSLNYPDCDEDVLWYVFETEQWISFDQMQNFIDLFIDTNDAFDGSGNTRAIQDTNSRKVYYSTSKHFVRVLAMVLIIFLF